MNLDEFTIGEHAPVKEALQQIENNHNGIILTTDETGVVTGLATDGDIRRRLLENASLDDPISSCANPDFISEAPGTPREMLIKKLDHRIRVIPLINGERKLVGIVSRDHLPAQPEAAVYARARSPVRVSFCGGGSDLTHYFSDADGAVMNTAISLFSHATLRIRNDEKIKIQSLDLNETLSADNLKALLECDSRFGLIQALLKVIRPEFGFELFLNSDFRMNSGLGGSAVVSAVVLGCFNQFRQDKWGLHELAELAYQAERLYLGVAGGWQDQYATVFGGFNFIEFQMEQNIVHPLNINAETLLELEESLILCDTGTSHDSGDIHEDQRSHMEQTEIKKVVKANVKIAYRMRDQLLKGEFLEFGQLLHETWQLKRKLSSKISTSRLDQIYNEARLNGAVGGKLLGAGGGGYFLFFVPPFRKHGLIAHLKQAGLRVQPFRFEQDGLKSWTVREGNYHKSTESE
jgi:D-glycero-alpha-D-manno-heptose-7-phosphate kinase